MSDEALVENLQFAIDHAGVIDPLVHATVEQKAIARIAEMERERDQARAECAALVEAARKARQEIHVGQVFKADEALQRALAAIKGE